MLQQGEDSSHGAPDVIGIQGHGHVDAVCVLGATLLPVFKGRGFAEDGKVRGAKVNDAQANAEGGGEGVEEEEDGQEAEEYRERG